ncbi:MAG: PilZ domain-containing protein, partial [Planctomycetota bacterium]
MRRCPLGHGPEHRNVRVPDSTARRKHERKQAQPPRNRFVAPAHRSLRLLRTLNAGIQFRWETGARALVHERAEPGLRVGERRRYLRYAETNRVLFVEVADAGKTHAGHLRDLSVGGLCLVTSREVSVGTRLCLGIFFEHEQD